MLVILVTCVSFYIQKYDGLCRIHGLHRETSTKRRAISGVGMWGSHMKDGRSFKNARTKEMQTLDYIQSVLLSCRDQAAGDRHNMLAYLIEMAYVEASDLLRRLNDTKKAS